MPTTLTERGNDPAASTTQTPQVDATLQLSTRTLAWLADHPHARRLVHSVWGTLAELERTGHHRGAINALRRVLTHHQPSPAGPMPHLSSLAMAPPLSPHRVAPGSRRAARPVPQRPPPPAGVVRVGLALPASAVNG